MIEHEKYITHEGKRTNKSNLKLLYSMNDNGSDVEILVSYWTPVAYAIDGLWHYTSTKYSPTTSKQITRFLNAKTGGRGNALEVEQEEIEKIYKNL